MKRKAPSAPAGLGQRAREWWRKMQAEYAVVDAGGLALLETAARAYGRMEQARALLDKEGVTTVDRWGQRRLHPAASVERDSRAGLLAALRCLHLDVEPVRDHAGRPGGR